MKPDLKATIEKLKGIIMELETITMTDYKIIKPENYHFNNTGETIHAGQPVNTITEHCKCGNDTGYFIGDKCFCVCGKEKVKGETIHAGQLIEIADMQWEHVTNDNKYECIICGGKNPMFFHTEKGYFYHKYCHDKIEELSKEGGVIAVNWICNNENEVTTKEGFITTQITMPLKNICQCCGNIRKTTTQADNGNYYCQTCKADATATAYQVRRYCSKCGIKLPSFFDVVGQDLLYCEKCTPAEIGGAGNE